MTTDAVRDPDAADDPVDGASGSTAEGVIDQDDATDEPLGEEVRAEQALLAQAIGGWRGAIDSSLPSVAFLGVYVIGGRNLPPALSAAVAVGLAVFVLRLARREPLQHVIGGAVGVALSAVIVVVTGRAADFFLTGLVANAVYGVAMLVSILVRRPLIGFIVGGLQGDVTGWLRDPQRRRRYTMATAVWVALFGVRLAVQLPMYQADAVGALGTAKLAMGWPLFVLAVFVTYVICRPTTRPEAVEA